MKIKHDNNPMAVWSTLAAIRNYERSCQRCGQVKLTIARGRAEFCLNCTEHMERARRQALEVH